MPRTERRVSGDAVPERCCGAEYRSSRPWPQPDVLADVTENRGMTGSLARHCEEVDGTRENCRAGENGMFWFAITKLEFIILTSIEGGHYKDIDLPENASPHVSAKPLSGPLTWTSCYRSFCGPLPCDFFRKSFHEKGLQSHSLPILSSQTTTQWQQTGSL